MKKIFYILFTFTCLQQAGFSLLTIYAQPSITWSKTYGQPFLLDFSNAICNTGAEFYYVGGYSTARGGYLIKINEYGDTTWSKTFPSITINTVIATTDGGCILAGNSDSLRILRLDLNGNIVWAKKYMQNLYPSHILDIRETSNNKYIACGYRVSQKDGIVLRFDENGNLELLKLYPANYFKNLYSIEETPDGGYLATGEVKDNDTVKTLLLRLDNSGNVVWEKQYKIFNQLAYGGYIKRLNTGYLVAGETRDTASISFNERLYFIRTDTGGNVIYTKLFTFHKSDDFYAAEYINDNKYIFSSFTFIQANYDTASYSKVMITD